MVEKEMMVERHKFFRAYGGQIVLGSARVLACSFQRPAGKPRLGMPNTTREISSQECVGSLFP